MTDDELLDVQTQTGIARCAPLDGQSAPYTVHGVAIGEGDVTYHEDAVKVWPAEALRAAAQTLVGVPLNKNHEEKRVESVIGEVVDAAYEEGVGVVFEAEVDDKTIATQITRGRLEVSIHAVHRAAGRDDDGRLIVSDVRFLDLSVVPRGAAPSNYVESGASEMLAELSLDDVSQMMDADASDTQTDMTEEDSADIEEEQLEADVDEEVDEAEEEQLEVEDEAEELDEAELADEPEDDVEDDVDVEALEAELAELREENEELRDEMETVRMDYAEKLSATNPAFEAEELAERYTYDELSTKLEAVDTTESTSESTPGTPAPRTGESESELSTSTEDEELVAELEAKIENYDRMGWDAAKAEAQADLDALRDE